MSGEIIKSFLIGLGFSVDDASLAKFNKAITSATLKVTALAVSVQAATAAVFYGITKIASSFEELGYSLRLVAPAINKFLVLRQAMINAYRAAGVNLVQAVHQSILFNLSLAKTKFALEAIYKSVGLKFLPLLTKQMDVFRKQIFANMPKIQEALIKFTSFLFKMFAATTQLGARVWSVLGRIWGFFVRLDEATGGWSTKILAVAAAWRILNLSFLATPLGALIAGLGALLLLYDDFKGQQEGKKHLINWNSPGLKALTITLTEVWNIVKAIGALINDTWNGGFDKSNSDLLKIADSLKRISDAIDNAIRSLHVPWIDKLLNLRDSAEKSIGDFFSGLSAAPALNSALQAPPLGSQYHNTSSNFKLSQETNILVQGGADANATGQAVASEQGKINFDLGRNLLGAVQ